MSEAMTYLPEWSPADLVDPRGQRQAEGQAVKTRELDSWPIRWKSHKVGLFSNKKPNADAMLMEVKAVLLAAAPNLTFVYGSKEPLAENAPKGEIDKLKDCDIVVLASAECGGCTSWVCRDYITLEELGVPCMLIATHRFETLARAVLAKGGVARPHLTIPQHPVSGITADAARARIHDLRDHINAEILGRERAVAAHKVTS